MSRSAAASFALAGLGRYPTSLHVSVAFLSLMVPVLLVRLMHTALCSHFLILIAIGLAIRVLRNAAQQRLAYWFTPLIVASFLTHVYIAAMVSSLFAASQLQAFLTRREHRRLIALQTLILILAVTSVYYLCGYNGGYGGAVFGFFSMNLYSPFVPQISSLFNRHKVIDPTGGQYEGFNYVGAGLLALFALSVLWAHKAILTGLRKYWCLPLLCLGLTCFALSTRVYAGSRLILDISNIQVGLFNQFRCSGRFFWPVTYLALVLSAAALWPQLEKRRCTWLIFLIVILQISDSDFQRTDQHIYLSHNRTSLTELRGTAQPMIAAHQRVTILPSFACAGSGDELWQVLDVVFLASEKAVPVNTAFLARVKDVVDCGREVPDVALRGPGPSELLVFIQEQAGLQQDT